MLKTLDATSNLIRAVVSLAVVGAVGAGGWVGYQHYYANELALKQKDEQLVQSQNEIKALNADIEIKKKEIERLDTAVRLLKVDHRVAQLTVLGQRKAPDDGRTLTRFSFVEVGEKGQPLEQPKVFEIDGDIVHVDSLVVAFKDEYVEKGDPLRGTALCLFRRIYGDNQKPSDGFPLDAVSARPAGYSRGSEPTDLEREIFANFWDYANDPEKADKQGVRTIHGKASYTQLRKGKSYRLMLRSTGDISLQAEDGPTLPGKAL
jgi:hypothetical protein